MRMADPMDRNAVFLPALDRHFLLHPVLADDQQTVRWRCVACKETFAEHQQAADAPCSARVAYKGLTAERKAQWKKTGVLFGEIGARLRALRDLGVANGEWAIVDLATAMLKLLEKETWGQ